MLQHRIKIFLSIIISFILVQGITYYTENPDFVSVQADNIKGVLSNIKFDAASLTRLMSLNIGPTEHNLPKDWNDKGENSVDLPSISNPPTQMPINNPTSFVPEPTDGLPLPTSHTPSQTPTRIPTNAPTSTPKPTKPPKPTPTPKPAAITLDARPGETLDEIFAEVQKRECVPAALLMAFKTKETGERFKSGSVKMYNTYGWWKSNNPCYGYAYYTQSGIIPPDSMNAGSTCANAIGDQSYDQKIMGILQISDQEQTSAFKYLKDSFPKNYDRRVMFDNAMIFARITKLRLGTPPKSCSDWPEDAIKLAAAKHSGGGSDTCKYYYSQNGVSGDYCKEILQLYKQYK